MAAGLFGYIGYDMVRLMERLPDENPDMLGLPDAILDAPDGDGGLRQHRRPDHAGDAGLAGRRHATRDAAYDRRWSGWPTRSPTWSAPCRTSAMPTMRPARCRSRCRT